MRLFPALLAVFLLAAAPLYAAGKSATAKSTAKEASAPAAAPASNEPPAGYTPSPAKGGTVKAGNIEISDISTSEMADGKIDVYMEIDNEGKVPDALVSAETPISDHVVMVTIEDKKETEAPLMIELPAGKSAEFKEKKNALRIKGIKKSLKEGDKFQLMLHFRSAPNAVFDITVRRKKSFFNW
ncbi:MAG: copper chaperone PCu(A)C [Alphaproteobacteria bacterium]|nr:copper chaperone PCu(A)C [Alphaproteobacteria bacterium]